MLTGLASSIASRAAGGKFEHGFLMGSVTYFFNYAADDHAQKAEQAQSVSPVRPTDHHKVTSGYSLDRVDPVTGQTSRPHTAIDIKNPHGDPVYSILDSEVVDVNSSSGAGNYIKVDHRNGLEASYSHTGSSVRIGDTVNRGQIIGHSDSSGRIHGPHLHVVVRKNGIRVNPCAVVTCP